MTKINCNFKGEKNGNSKLTFVDVQQIIGLYEGGGYTYQSLASMAGISKAHVHRIVKGKSWK